MNELYWITRLDAINDWSLTLAILCGIFWTISIIVVSVNYGTFLTADYSSDRDCAKAAVKVFKPIRKYSFIVFCIATLASIFIPTKNDAMLIWGVGSTIDYIQDNEKIQNLPDKCVDALDAWVESLSDNKEEKK